MGTPASRTSPVSVALRPFTRVFTVAHAIPLTHAGGGANEELGNVFRFLGRYYRSRFSRISALVQGATVPVIVLVFGVLVGIVTLSLFAPMVSLITNMSAGGMSWQL